MIVGVEAVGHGAKFAIQPASTGTHKRVLRGELREHILLKKRFDTCLEICTTFNVIFQVPQRVKNCLLYSEVLIWLFEILSKDLEIVLQIVRDLLFSIGFNTANHAHDKFHYLLRIERVLMIYLHSHVLNGVFCPELILSLSNEHQG